MKVKVMIFCIAMSQEISQVHNYDPKLKSWLPEYCHPTSTRKKTFNTQPSAGKCMFTVLWDYRGIIQLEDMIKGKKIKFLDGGGGGGRETRLLQHDKARLHTSTATSTVVALDFKLFHFLPTARLWHCLTYGCLQLLRNISKEFMSPVMKKF
jgi:hypothetical protein